MMKHFYLISAFFIISSSSIAAYAQDQPITGSFETIIGQIENDHHRELFTEIDKRNNTLFDALKSAYEKNPTLRAARSELLITEEQLPQAKAGFKPAIEGKADITHTNTKTDGDTFFTSDGDNLSKTAAIQIEQSIFSGGSTVADIKQAKNTINAQQLLLSNTEQALLYEAAVAYMDVYQASAVLKLNKNNEALVKKQLEQAQNRFSVGELTQTDVSQAQARLASTQADVIRADGNLKSMIAVYKKIVMEPPPIDIAYPEKNIMLPETLEDAISLAESNNRAVLQAKYIKRAAKSQVDSYMGRLFPQISAVGSLSKSYDQSDFIDEQRQAAIGLNATIPLYRGGVAYSRIREAKERVNQRDIQIIEAANTARQEAISNWEALEAARAELKARALQIEASRIARQGVQYETEFGERTTIDALDANQELLDSQVQYTIAKRNEVVARFALARTLGLLVPQNLGFSTINP